MSTEHLPEPQPLESLKKGKPKMEAPQFHKNLKALPKVSHLRCLELWDFSSQQQVGVVENKAGQMASLAIYNYLAQFYGFIDQEAALHGLQLYAEYADEAMQLPGKHPHIDRLMAIAKPNAELAAKAIEEAQPHSQPAATRLQVKAIFYGLDLADAEAIDDESSKTEDVQ